MGISEPPDMPMQTPARWDTHYIEAEQTSPAVVPTAWTTSGPNKIPTVDKRTQAIVF